MSVSVNMTTKVLDNNISALEAAIALVEKKKEETYSGVDMLLLDSFIIETREVLAVLNEAKDANVRAPQTTYFNYVTQPEA